MSHSENSETSESMNQLMSHIQELNRKLRKNNILNGQGENWLNQNVPDWKVSVDNRVVVRDTRFGYPKAYPRFKQPPKSFGR